MSTIRDIALILDIKNMCNSFIEINNNNEHLLRLKWIRSHTGIEGNEEADRLAVEVTETAPNFPLLLPFTEFRRNLKRNFLIPLLISALRKVNTKALLILGIITRRKDYHGFIKVS
uniref:RNase H type-1 domain-containing protein n=1 Tax=Bracon brevicornis TaxID=1563983 RepID=A0A6V7LAW3_9HYME